MENCSAAPPLPSRQATARSGSSAAGFETTYTLSCEDDPERELPQIRRQVSKGLTGETYYDYDLPLNRDDPITILHFNDVYNVQATANCGGIARFITALREHSGEHPLILFSGDAFNPSLMSAHSRGRHMVPFLNMLRIHTAVFGNHDFDFGVDHLEYLAGSTRFPWLLSNVFDADEQPLANGISYRLFEWQGTRVGIIGLVEYEWLSTLATLDEDDVIYRDFVEEANRLSAVLRGKEAELIIALTHMRAPNDERLAREADDIDLILGGHDHEYYGVRRIGRTVVCKSGSDFREFTKLVVFPERTSGISAVPYDEDAPPPGVLKPGNRQGGCVLLPSFREGSSIVWSCVDVTSEVYRPNKHVDILVGRYNSELQAQLDKIIGESAVPLETRFPVIRKQETNCGNWLCDIMRKECKVQVAVLNSGTVRADCIIPPGPFRMRDLQTMLPMLDPLVVVEVTGAQLLKVLENGVSKYPRTEGRFLQVSGLRFAFDADKPVGQRVLGGSVTVLSTDSSQELPIDTARRYTLVTKEYLVMGKDGFDVFTECRVIRDSEETPNLPTMIRNVLSMAAMANGFKRPHHRLMTKRLQTLKTMTPDSLQHGFGLGVVEKDTKQLYLINPQIDNRITNIGGTTHHDADDYSP